MPTFMLPTKSLYSSRLGQRRATSCGALELFPSCSELRKEVPAWGLFLAPARAAYALRRALLMVFSTVMALSAFGQRPTPYGESTFKVSPQSPTAAALGKYVDLPVSLATGTPQINIPLYEIKSGELTLPISLSYQATGFRVGERAGWTGLGWSLQAGGVINRTIRDKKDDGSFERPSRNFGWGDYQVDTPNVKNPTDYHYLNMLMDSGILPDGQPDVFSFSFPGHSGKFIRPTMQTIQLLPIQPLDISFSGRDPGTINGVQDMARWHIVDERGQAFEFGATELSERSHGRDVASWFLTSMVSASGRDTLEFEYSEPHESPCP